MNLQNLISILKNYDVKNINPAKIQRYLLLHKDIALNAGLIIITFFVSIMLSQKYSSGFKEANQQLEKLQEKAFAVEELEESKKQIESIISSMPEGITETSKIVDEINALANEHNIIVTSYQPQPEISHGFYDEVSVDLSISADSYSDIGRFIKSVENSDYIFIITKWGSETQRTSRSRRRGGRREPAEVEEGFSANITITSIKIKNA